VWKNLDKSSYRKYKLGLVRENYFIENIKNKTNDLLNLADDNLDCSLKYIHNQTVDILQLAIQQNEEVIDYIKNHSGEIKKGYVLYYIKNQTDEINKFFYQRKRYIIRQLKNKLDDFLE
jgi:transcription initiation factor IIE alpha subunit